MDLLSQRYASPFFILNQAIENDEFYEWIIWFIKKYNSDENEQKTWEMFLHKDFESESYNEFKSRVQSSVVQNHEMTKEEKTAIIGSSDDILNNFVKKKGVK